MRIGDQEYIRLRVLKALRGAEPVSRTELARLCGLTGATITEIVGDLVQRRFVLEEKVRSGLRGRPRVNLRLNPDGSHVVGAFHGSDGVLTVEVVNLKGECKFSHSEALPVTAKLDERARQIAGVVANAIAASPLPARAISHVGVGLPAIVDFRNGVVEYMASFEPGPCPLAAIVSEQLGIPVTVDNDISVLARAEHWFGDTPGIEDFALVVVGLGLGSAQYAGGQSYFGAHGISPEMGHTKVVFDNGRLCHCGARGCLQAYSSISGILGQYCEARGIDLPPYLQWTGLLRQVAGEARAGNSDAGAIVERAGRYLGIAIANHVNLNDPARIILFFEEPELLEMLSASFGPAFEENTLPILRGRAALEARVLDKPAYWKGTAALGLEQIYHFR